ncbi:Amidophosphoribosyltransferase [Clostridiaceae bacterium JG1575]|nr:Amidophosphoribosyltransferase [Clostridiaceae bacterium JG1575]
MHTAWQEDDKLREECGVFGMNSFTGKDVAEQVYYGLYALQHRGQESAGIASNQGGDITLKKNMGLVQEAFAAQDLKELQGDIAIGHVRYSTCGESSMINAQPLVGRSKLGQVSVAHNGTLVNAGGLRELLEESGIMFQTTIDSEVILSLLMRSGRNDLEQSLKETLRLIKGAFALTLTMGSLLVGIRDPYGIRPLVLGKTDDNYILASESCALDVLGAELVRDIEPGEMVLIEKDQIRSVFYSERTQRRVCSFEYIYFARPDSDIDGLSVHASRVAMGEALYREHPVDADLVIGVPDSGIAAALGYARASGIPFDIGFTKNKYIGRTFIAPSQEIREKNVNIKLNALRHVVAGKRLVLIDDSIVRGTTSRRLIETLRFAGAKEIHFLVSSPMVKHPCYFGIDTPYREHLIAAVKTKEEIEEEIGADSLAFISKEGLLQALGDRKGYCLGCFSGVYPMDIPQDEEHRMDQERLGCTVHPLQNETKGLGEGFVR